MKLKEPKIVSGETLHFAGIDGHYTRERTGDIPALWDRFNPMLYASALKPADWEVTYGVIYPGEPMRYLCGIGVDGQTPLPEAWVQVEIPPQRYAIFAETGGVAAIRAVWPLIYSEWLPRSGYKTTGGPMLERYDAGWNKAGDFEIWIPVEAAAAGVAS
jgi:AraC family transcriptional regulator